MEKIRYKKIVSGSIAARFTFLLCTIIISICFATVVAAESDQELAYRAQSADPFVSANKRRYTGRLDKLIGGKRAKWEENSWQVALLIATEVDPFDGVYCGGTLITEDKGWVLTAAHCVYDREAKAVRKTEEIDVLSGTPELSVGEGVRSKVRAIFVHESYDPEWQDYDIALVRLQGSADAESKFVALPSSEAIVALETDGSARVTGWGLTGADENAQLSEQLLEIDVSLINTEKCNAPESWNGYVTPRMICAGEELGGQDSCSADSGGPLTRDSNLIGLVSSSTCGQPLKYGVYTRFSAFSRWVADCIRDPSSCTSLR